MSGIMNILAIAQSILAGQTVAKADGQDDDPDAMAAASAQANAQGGAEADTRAGGAATSQEDLDKARADAQASQQAAAAQGGEPGAGGEGGEGGGGDGDGDDDGSEGGEIAKAEILESMKFLANMHGISGEEVAKAFSGLEGDPTKGKAPVGGGVEILERIVEGQNAQNKILEAIASFLQELSRSHVSLSGEVAKAITNATEAKAEALKTSETLAAAIRTATPAPQKGLDHTVAKALLEGQGQRPLTSNDLFQVALSGKLSPVEAAAANRSIHHGGN